ncbi:MAG: 2-dehydropantoate 2-reductase [Pseudomonadota bacterium]
MRIAIVGSGGLGGYFGARLAAGGSDVHFLARGGHLAAMRENGLSIEGGPNPVHVADICATENPSEIGPVDLALIAVKLWDTERVLEQIRPLVGSETAIVSCQNGVLKDFYLKAAFPERQTMGGVAYVATTIDRPGVIRQTGAMQRLIIGEFDGRRSERAECFFQACQRGGIAIEISGDIERDIWEKFVFLVGLSGTTTTMRSVIGPIRENPVTRAFLLDVMREVVAVARARGIDLPEDYAEIRLKLADDVAADMTSSMHHDLQRGNRLEAPWLSGGVVKLGAEVGVSTPLNRAISDILALHTQGTSKV